MLRLLVVRKSFAGRDVIAALSLQLGEGEIVAVAGPSGCGKSTLLRIIAGLDRDFAGTADWVGRPRLAMAFQEPRLLPWRSVRDNLLLAGAPAQGAQAMLAALGVAGAAEVMADRLSLGMARRVALARALSVAPDLVLLDEAFVSLDAAAAAHARDTLLRAWTARPFTVLLVTHDLAEAAALADRILILSGPPARVLREVAVPPAIRRTGGAAAAAFAAALLAGDATAPVVR